jgi:hypothetical protein
VVAIASHSVSQGVVWRDAVAHSATWMKLWLTVPRTAGGRKPPEMKAATLVPPSQGLSFDPRSGQLFGPVVELGPPLRIIIHNNVCVMSFGRSAVQKSEQ